jgi:hypothetical protein
LAAAAAVCLFCVYYLLQVRLAAASWLLLRCVCVVCVFPAAGEAANCWLLLAVQVCELCALGWGVCNRFAVGFECGRSAIERHCPPQLAVLQRITEILLVWSLSGPCLLLLLLNTSAAGAGAAL